MTQPTTESRLDRLEAITETVLLAIQQQQQQSQAVQAEIQSTRTEMRQSIEDVVQMIATLAESADEDRKLIVGMQTAITGIQTENRRILDHLLNQQ
jgi:prophage DNA circulation protein